MVECFVCDIVCVLFFSVCSCMLKVDCMMIRCVIVVMIMLVMIVIGISGGLVFMMVVS